jgi:heme-degrading monooxygenase HmoA
MIAVISEFGLPSSFTPEKARAVFKDSTGKFENMPGLIRKYFLLSEDGKTAASVYLWESRAPAEAFFTEEWKEFMVGKYGHRPAVTFFECPVVVDNHTGEVIKQA